MAYRSDQVQPTAKIVIKADDHVQLDQILSYYQQRAGERSAAGSRG
ncbi:MAG: hypothetical protein M3Y24_03030 [Acidobacteriota bacterium]|nr:hypothetical protein [Acidobacteriota bacterium]